MVNKKKIVDGKAIGFIERFLNENAPTVAIVGAIGLLGASLFAAFKASGEVSEVNEKYEQKVEEIENKGLSEDEKAKIMREIKSERNIKYILAYKWAILFGGGSTALMILSNVLNGAKIAGLTTALALSQDKLKKLAENGKKLLGEKPWMDVENKTLEDLVMENFVTEDGRVALKPDKSGGSIFVDTDTGALIQIDENELIEVIQRAEEYCSRNHELYRDKWFEMLGVEPPTGSKVRCWGPKNPFKAHIGTRTFHNMTVGSIEYENSPQVPWAAGIPGAKKPD